MQIGDAITRRSWNLYHPWDNIVNEVYPECADLTAENVRLTRKLEREEILSAKEAVFEYQAPDAPRHLYGPRVPCRCDWCLNPEPRVERVAKKPKAKKRKRRKLPQEEPQRWRLDPSPWTPVSLTIEQRATTFLYNIHGGARYVYRQEMIIGTWMNEVVGAKPLVGDTWGVVEGGCVKRKMNWSIALFNFHQVISILAVYSPEVSRLKIPIYQLNR